MWGLDLLVRSASKGEIFTDFCLGTSLYKLWKEFDKHSNVGGACGEITVDLGRGCSNVLNPLVAAQNFEVGHLG